MSESSESSFEQEESGGELEVVTGEIEPYVDEPLASDDDHDADEDSEADQDGLTPSVLEGRFERQVAVREC